MSEIGSRDHESSNEPMKRHVPLAQSLINIWFIHVTAPNQKNSPIDIFSRIIDVLSKQWHIPARLFSGTL